MADKKLEKALYGPSMTEVALGAVLGLLLGLLAASVYLVFKPVAAVKELPKEPLRSVVYYITVEPTICPPFTPPPPSRQNIELPQ